MKISSRRKRNYLYAAVLFAVLGVSVVLGVWPVQAAETRQWGIEAAGGGGLLPIDEIRLCGGEAGEIAVYEPQKERRPGLFSELFRAEESAQEEAYWRQYSNYYLYNLMSGEEQAYYDLLDQLCMDFILSEDEAVYNKANDIYYLPCVFSDELTREEMKRVYSIFRYNNGQYYFINSRIITIQKDGRTGIAPGVYGAFCAGSERAQATRQVKEQLDLFSLQAAGEETPARQAQRIHDLIIDKVYYNNAINSADFDDETELSQTIYSVLCMDKTVCAGYAQTFAVLCNRAGIDAVSVTSATHEWNKVRLHDSWYNVDCTWDDQGGPVYTYYLRSDAVYDAASRPQSHAEEALWDGFLPPCTLDSAPKSSNEPGVPAEITARTLAPALTAVWQEGERRYLVTITCAQEDAGIYYTVNGELPSPARSKSSVYRQQFLAEPECFIQAAAVCDAHLDSEIGRLRLAAVTPPLEEPESETPGTQTSESQDVPVRTETPESGAGTGTAGSETGTSEGGAGTGTAGSETGTSEGGVGTGTAGSETGTPESESCPGTPGNGQGEPGSGAGGTPPVSGSEEIKPPLKKGDTFTVATNTYRITKTGSKAAVKFVRTAKTTTALKIPSSVRYRGVQYRVTEMAARACGKYNKIKTVTVGNNISKIPKNAFEHCANLKKVTLGTGITTIEKGAFLQCKKLGTIIIKSKKVSKVGANAFRGIKATAQISVPAGKLKVYQKRLKGKGQGGKVKIKAYR